MSTGFLGVVARSWHAWAVPARPGRTARALAGRAVPALAGLNPPAPPRTHRAQGPSVFWLLCFLRIFQGCLADLGKRD